MRFSTYTLMLSILSSVQLLLAQTNTCDTSIGENGVLTTHDDAKIGIFGNLENNGTFTDVGETSEVGFYSSTNSLEINGTNTPEFANLIVDVTQDLQLNVKSEVVTGVLFLEGSIITPRNIPDTSLDLINTDVTVNVDNERHVDGYTSYTGIAAYTFPIGNANRFRPLIVETGASLNTTKAAYFFENPTSPNSFPLNLNTTETSDEVFNVSTFEFWDLNGSSTTRVTLTWDIMSNISQLLDTNDLEDLIVTGWSIEDQEWVDLGNFSVTGNLSQGSITSNLIDPDDYEALTFATNTPIDETPVGTDLVVFNGISSGELDDVNDFFAIKNISQFPENTLQIFNRWGVKVFDVDGYDAEPVSSANFQESTKAFRGKSDGRINIEENELLPVGTYYYVLTYIVGVGGGEKTQAGYLYINR